MDKPASCNPLLGTVILGQLQLCNKPIVSDRTVHARRIGVSRDCQANCSVDFEVFRKARQQAKPTMFEGWWSNDAEYVELQTVDGYEGDGVAMHKEAKSSIDSVKRRYTMLIFWTTSTATLVSFATWLVVTLSAPYATTKVCTALLRFDGMSGKLP